MGRRRSLTARLSGMAVILALQQAGGAASLADIQVGAYYYPWHGPGAHTPFQSLRGHLVPRHPPALGDYNNASAAVISAHIDYSHRANISFWAVSWWGPASYEDRVFRNNILPHLRAGELRYAIHYESAGRLGSFDSPNYAQLLVDFQYLSTHYFSNPNYLTVGGRPVVFLYLTRVYFRGQGDEALADLRQAYPNLYLVGDDVFGTSYSSSYAEKWDAVSAYDVYGQSLQGRGSTESALSRLETIYANAKSLANSVDVGFIPAACPGFNDKGVRAGHPAAPRYLEDDAASVEGDLFRKMLLEVAVPKVDELAAQMLMITSFNEWHEDTQIEPTAGFGNVTQVDDSDSTTAYTEGKLYTDYGTLYLDILCSQTCLPDSDGDTIKDCCDNCVDVANEGQEDTDGDGIGDACDDADGDGVIDVSDNCVGTENPGQEDFDLDGMGDACDDSDGDTVLDASDNCRGAKNPEQKDADGDGIGDMCEAFRRGDANDDGTVDISDAVATLDALFLGEAELACEDAADSNDDGEVDLSDAVATLGVLFMGSGTIPGPGQYDCGVDPTGGDVGCGSHGNCP